MIRKTLSALAAGASFLAIAAVAQAQSAPQFENLTFANDTSWAGVEFHGDPVGAYGPQCAFALQMDVRRMTNSSRELVVQTACENAENTEINFIVPEGRSEAISNLPHTGRQFYDISADGREIRFVREFDPSVHDGISRDRVRIRVNSRDNSTDGRVFWEVRQNGQWREIGSAVIVRLLDHDVLRPVLDEGVPQTAAIIGQPSATIRRTRMHPIEIRPNSDLATNVSLYQLASDLPFFYLAGAPVYWTAGSDGIIRLGNEFVYSGPNPGLGGRPPARNRQ